MEFKNGSASNSLCSVAMWKQVCSTLKVRLQEFDGSTGVKIQDFDCVWWIYNTWQLIRSVSAMIPQNQGGNWGKDVAALLEVQKESEDLHKQNVGTDEIFNLFSGTMKAMWQWCRKTPRAVGMSALSLLWCVSKCRDMMRQVLLIALMCKSPATAHGARPHSEGKNTVVCSQET